jgi:hypothetical protein
MVYAVGPDPLSRRPLHGQTTTDGQNVFEPLGCLKGSMREEAMKSEAYSDAATGPPENECNGQPGPCESPRREEDDGVHDGEINHRGPAELATVQVVIAKISHRRGGCIWAHAESRSATDAPRGTQPRVVYYTKGLGTPPSRCDTISGKAGHFKPKGIV